MKRTLLAVLFGLLLTATLGVAQVVVDIGPPPPARVERRFPPPSPRHVWISGYYNWDGRAYVWVPGYWTVPPRPRAVWIAPRWIHRRRGWVLVTGHWRY